VRLVAVQPSEGDRDRAFAQTQTVLKVHPNVRVVMGDRRAGRAGGRRGGAAVGAHRREGHRAVAAEPRRPYVKAGVVESIVLWNTTDLGALTSTWPTRSRAGS
jgi:rhamnose transport system permease protein